MAITIEQVTHHGMGRGSDGGLYARCLTGEVVEPQADGTVRVLTPSPDRVAAPCRHFRTCGGCAMQHASDGFVAGWKAGNVARALAAQGVEAVMGEVVTSPPQSRRRAKLAGRRTKAGALLGFHGRASDQIVASPDCQLLKPALQRLFPALETLVTLAASRSSEVAITLTDTPNGADILLDGGRELTADLRRDLAGWAEDAGIARLVWGADLVAQRLPPALPLGRAQVVPPPGAFLQATDQGEAALVAGVRAGVGGAPRVADLFAGCGTFSLPLAERAEVLAVEGEAPMLAALDRGWRGATGLRRVVTLTRDLFRNPLLPADLKPFGAVVLDPPRAGAEAQAVQLAQSQVPVIVMVSCHPATFARDARILGQGGYRPGPVTVVDQFRWSPHVEILATFTKA